MSLPNSIDSAAPLGSANANTTDDVLRALKVAVEDLLGIPDATAIAAAGAAFGAAGLTALVLDDTANPAAVGHLRLNQGQLRFHNGGVRRVYHGPVAGPAQVIPVADGGTGLTAGTSGGVLGYTASGTLASSAALTARGLVVGGGAGATPAALAALTDGQQYIGSTGANPVPGALTAGTHITLTPSAGGLAIAKRDRTTMEFWGIFAEFETGLYCGPGGGGGSATATAGRCPHSGLLTDLYTRLFVTTNTQLVGLRLRKNGAVVSEFSHDLTADEGLEAIASVTGQAVAVSAGDLLVVEADRSDGATNADTYVKASLRITPTAS